MAIQEKNPVSQAGFQIRACQPNSVFALTGNASGATGNSGDRLQRLIVNIINPAAANVSILDGNVEYPLVMPAASIPAAPMFIELGLYSFYGAWSVRCGPGATAVAIGVFS